MPHGAFDFLDDYQSSIGFIVDKALISSRRKNSRIFTKIPILPIQSSSKAACEIFFLAYFSF